MLIKLRGPQTKGPWTRCGMQSQVIQRSLHCHQFPTIKFPSPPWLDQPWLGWPCAGGLGAGPMQLDQARARYSCTRTDWLRSHASTTHRIVLLEQIWPVDGTGLLIPLVEKVGHHCFSWFWNGLKNIKIKPNLFSFLDMESSKGRNTCLIHNHYHCESYTWSFVFLHFR